MANNFELSFPAKCYEPPASAHPDRGVVQNRHYVAFDAATVETAYSPWFQWPAAYTGSGTVKADIAYAMASATANKVDFEVSLEALTSGDSVDTDSASSFDTANAGNQSVPGTAGHPKTLTVTISNKASVAAGDWVRFKLERDADDGTDDTATGDARVYGVCVREEA
jgi:hypothetical protein